MRIKQKYIIDFSKSVTWITVLGLICYFNQTENITAWIYFCLHGSYGIMWVMKSNIFPDKSWEKKANLPYAIFILFCLMTYWSPAFIITMQGHEASINVIVASVIIFIFGVFYHFFVYRVGGIWTNQRRGIINCVSHVRTQDTKNQRSKRQKAHPSTLKKCKIRLKNAAEFSQFFTIFHNFFLPKKKYYIEIYP